MALRTEEQWKTFIHDAGVADDATCTTYAQAFVTNHITETSLPQMDKESLVELGFGVLGHRLSLMSAIKSHNANKVTHSAKASVNAKLPELTLDMTHPQFRKFKCDWDVYKKILALPPQQCTSHLYNACDTNVQTSIINTHPDFLDYAEDVALAHIENIVTHRIHPAVHRKDFRLIVQGEKEPTQKFITRLRSAAIECAFQCPGCNTDLSKQ